MKRLVLLATAAMITLSLPAQLLWKISGNGMKKDSYVLGTFHLVPASAMNMITGLDEALENCDIVVGESDYKEQKPTEGTKWYELPAACEVFLPVPDLDPVLCDEFAVFPVLYAVWFVLPVLCEVFAVFPVSLIVRVQNALGVGAREKGSGR